MIPGDQGGLPEEMIRRQGHWLGREKGGWLGQGGRQQALSISPYSRIEGLLGFLAHSPGCRGCRYVWGDLHSRSGAIP